jgi:DNA polymerase/3'-5' exonuclease PolX
MNTQIINQLSILQKHYKHIKDNWRSMAYGKAIASIRALDFEITNIKQLKGVKNVGKSISAKIEEMLSNGSINKVEEVKSYQPKLSEKEQILKTFEAIWGVGPVKAKTLYDKGMRTIKDVRNNQHLLTDQQIIGLKYYEDLLKKVPRDLITQFNNVLDCVFSEYFPDYKFQIAGSYRRGKKESGDVDLLVSIDGRTLSEVVAAMKGWGLITDTLSLRSEKFMGIARMKGVSFRLDIEFIPKSEWDSCLLYFTGSKETNVMMRTEAKKQGMILNQKGLFKNGKRISTGSEKEIFQALGMKYLTPEKR